MKRNYIFLLLAAISLVVIQFTVVAQDTAPVPEVLTLPEQIAGGRPVTITVTDKPASDNEQALANWNEQVARFNALYPNVTVEGLEMQYDPAAFTALIAGGQVPTLFRTYFTEPGKLINEGVVADLSPYFETAGIADVFNPEILNIATEGDALYGIPQNAYALGLAYNIPMLAAAGYDAPPATWDELVEMATALTNHDEGIAGFAFINDGSGAAGWHFTNIAYSFGASPSDIIAVNEDGSATATFGTGPAADAMQFVHDLRWKYDVLPGATLNWGSISEALVAGRVAMVIYAGDQFDFVYNQFPDADMSQFGYAAIPASDNTHATLSGGNVWMISSAASADEQEAAAYFQFWRQFDPSEMQSDIEVTTEAVGRPMLPLYVGDYQKQWDAFRAAYNVLPVENYAAFNNAIINGEVKIQSEPVVATQDYYSEIGVVISEVLSSESVDPLARIAEAADEFQSFVLDRN